MAIRRKKPSQPARLSDQPGAVHQYTKAHRVSKVNSSNHAVRNVIAAPTTTRQPQQPQGRINDSVEPTSSKCSGGPTSTSSSSRLSASTVTPHGGDENRSDNAVLQHCKDGNCRTGMGAKSDDGSVQQDDGVCKLQNRLRDNWSKLVTDRITMMAFARSLKGHKCPAYLYCQS